MVDCLLIHTPRYVHFSDPPIAPAYIHSYLKLHGYESDVLDLSLDWYKRVQNNIPLYEEIDSWFMLHNKASSLKYEQIGRVFGNVLGQPFGEGSTAAIKTDDDLQLNMDDLSLDAQMFLNEMLESWIEQIEFKNPKVVGISLFTYNSLKITKLLIIALQVSTWNGYVALGGPGALPKREKLADMVDLYATGPGEIAMLEFMDEVVGRTSQNVLDPSNHYPDFSDFNLSNYKTTKSVRITGSRGCIKRCNFCDIYKQWPQFISRHGYDIANEMILQNQLLPTHPTKFYFTDSLINGNPKSLRQMCEYLIQSNTNFNWEGQFIATSPKFFTQDDYAMMAKAGCNRVSFGIESGSNAVRLSMNKKQRDEDIDYCITELHKNNIEQVWLMIVGFPTETLADFAQTLDLFYRFKDLNKIKPIQCGLAEFRPDEGTDWHIANFDQLDWEPEGGWIWYGNSDLTSAERRLRLLYLEKKITEWGYIHRAQNSPFGNESKPAETLNSLYNKFDTIDFTDLEERLCEVK